MTSDARGGGRILGKDCYAFSQSDPVLVSIETSVVRS